MQLSFSKQTTCNQLIIEQIQQNTIEIFTQLQKCIA